MASKLDTLFLAQKQRVNTYREMLNNRNGTTWRSSENSTAVQKSRDAGYHPLNCGDFGTSTAIVSF